MKLLLCRICPTTSVIATDNAAYDEAAAREWEEFFSDASTGDWRRNWFLVGKAGTVTTNAEGMTLAAGPEFGNDAHHMVLWTKDSFEDDLKIDYEFTRTDNETRCVNIPFIQATGSGHDAHHEDITKWNALRKTSAMATCFNHMHSYHPSYADCQKQLPKPLTAVCAARRSGVHGLPCLRREMSRWRSRGGALARAN